MTGPDPRVAPVDPISTALAGLVTLARTHTGGAVADYIPELATADPEAVGVSIVSVLGRVYAAGDTTTEFTIQSVSKPFVYALAVADNGLDEVLRHVGSEPSGEPFNAISLDGTGRPANPMINAGAIVTTSLVRPAGDGTRFGRILQVLSAFAGRDLDVDDTVYQSELTTGHRNRALAHLALASGALVGDVDAATEDYFRQCSVRVTVVDLAIMAATLANAGINPVTRVPVVDARTARHTMSMMASCGMYDHAGDWGLRVGLPAKSGVSGGIVAVTSGQFGIGVYSPPLDPVGNSVRGVATLTEMSDRFGLHMLEHTAAPVSPIDRIAVEGATLQVRLRGEIDFIAAEQLVHTIRTADRGIAPITRLELHLDDATELTPIADRLLAAALGNAVAFGLDAVVIDPAGVLRSLEGHGGLLAEFRTIEG